MTFGSDGAIAMAPIDAVGWDAPDAFLVGYGMDVAHAFRELPFVFVGSAAMAAGGLGMLGAPEESVSVTTLGALDAAARGVFCSARKRRSATSRPPCEQTREMTLPHSTSSSCCARSPSQACELERAAAA